MRDKSVTRLKAEQWVVMMLDIQSGKEGGKLCRLQEGTPSLPFVGIQPYILVKK
jgi:hypothetical protein